MVLGAAAAAGSSAAAAAVTGGTLFEYNRENFIYDRKMRQETEYQIMDFRIRQAELWREDVKDIIGLTSVKMDTYLIVNAVQLGFCVMAFCEGRLAAGTPTWLIGCHTLSLGGAFMYLLLSVWLAMHASITAKAYEVRLLTQHVRLPVPTWAQLEGARTYMSGFEKVNPSQMFRVPFAMGTQEGVLSRSAPVGGAAPPARAARGGASGSGAASSRNPPAPAGPAPAAPDAEAPATSDLWGLERRGDHLYELDGTLRSDPNNLRHLRLVQEALQYWQSYDGFSRVAMSMGTNQLILALTYYVIGYVLISNHAIMAGWLVVVLFMVVAAALIRLDMSLTLLEYRTAVFLVVAGPCFTALAAQQWDSARETALGESIINFATPIAYGAHASWLMFLLFCCRVSENQSGTFLPTGFRSVMYIDVFGWISRRAQQQEASRRMQRRAQQPAPGQAPEPSDAGVGALSEPVPGSGPAVQAVNFHRRRPVPSRPEELPGAAEPPQDRIRREDFEPTTFVPRVKENEDREEAITSFQAYHKPGWVPWRIFCCATSLLIVLWWALGVLVLLDNAGQLRMSVRPLIRQEHESDLPGAAGLLATAEPLTGGEHINTTWPREHLQLHSLACGGDEGMHTLVSISRFSLFATRLNDTQQAKFSYTPPCDDIEGEALQDVGVVGCDAKAAAPCPALVLHRQGQRLSACATSDGGVSWRSSSSAPAEAMSLADAWLDEGDPGTAVHQEEVTSVALAGNCSATAAEGGQGNCAYAATSGGRVVEMQTGLAQGSAAGAGPDWFPTRVVQAAGSGGALRLIGAHHLARLGAEDLEAMDLRDGNTVGRWRLPAGHRWAAMCSAGSSLYLLDDQGSSPQLWRFPLPKELRAADAHGKVAPAAVAAGAADPVGDEASALQRLSRRHRAPARAHAMLTVIGGHNY